MSVAGVGVGGVGVKAWVGWGVPKCDEVWAGAKTIGRPMLGGDGAGMVKCDKV